MDKNINEHEIDAGAQPASSTGVPSKHKSIFLAPHFVWLMLAAALVAALWSVVRRSPIRTVNRLLAAAYTEKRIMEPRITGASYAPLQITRGPLQSAMDQPAALLEANAEIAKQLKAQPDDPNWLHAKAQAELLASKYDPAIEILQRVIDVQPDSAEAMIDLATAYYQRAEANNDREIDYGIAIEYLGRALSKAPNDVLALFNRGTVERRLHLYQPAADDWQHYLQIDSSGEWASEVHKQLEDVEAKIKAKERLLTEDLPSPEKLAALAETQNLAEQLDARAEDYLRVAITEWLPAAFPEFGPSSSSREASAALTALAAVIQERHQDSWLSDLLHDAYKPGFAAAVAALAAAVHANDKGDYDSGLKAAHRATGLFATAGNATGALRAQEEEIYSDHLLYHGVECMNLVRDLEARLKNLQYQWLQAQTDLEESNCASLLGDLGTDEIRRGTTRAADHHYTSLFLRGLGFLAVIAGYTGDTQQDFSLACKGLDLFWSSNVDLIKGYNLYTHLDKAADVLRLPYLQVALWRQATALADLHPDMVQRAMAHNWYGNSAYLAHMTDIAAAEFAKARLLFQQAAAGEPTAHESTERSQLDAETRLASLEVRQDDLQQAADHLSEVEKKIGPAPSFGIAIGFYSAQAELALRRRDSSAGDSAVKAAVFLAEWALKNFSGENTRTLWAKRTSQAYRDWVAWKLRRGEDGDALEIWEWYKGAGSRSQQIPGATLHGDLDSAVTPDVHNASNLDVPDLVTQRLPELNKHTIVAYAVLPDGISAWVYDNRGIFHYPIAAQPAELEARAAQFQRLCSTRDSDLKVLRSVARELYDLLIGPLEKQLVQGRTLVIEPDGILANIPMEALIDRTGRYLVERSAVVTIASFYQSLHARAETVINDLTPALIVAVPSPAEDQLTPLSSDVTREIEAIKASFRSPELLNGPEANLAAIQRKMAKSKLFHFVGHALALQERNGLLLAERDIHTHRALLINAQSLDAESIQNLQLAVLSACSTGLPVSLGATGTESLVEFLLGAGVPHVVASRWNVDSGKSAVLMRAFYSGLRSSKSVADALRDSQLALLAQQGLEHPFYWAAFGVQGK